MTDKYLDKYKLFIDKWGLDSQINICIEEMSELTKELCKYNRYFNDKEKLKEIIENIKSEIADVVNTAEQLQYYFGAEEIEKIRQEKINRAIKKLEEAHE